MKTTLAMALLAGILLIMISGCAQPRTPAPEPEMRPQPAIEIQMGSGSIMSGNAQLGRIDGKQITVRINQNDKAEVVFNPFAVQGDSIYRVALTMRRSLRIDVDVRIQELDGGKVTAEHKLAFWPGYRPIPPWLDQIESLFAVTPAGKSARLYISLSLPPQYECKENEIGIERLTIRAINRVTYPVHDSVNFFENGNCEVADAQGVVKGFGRWGGAAHNAKIEHGQGRNGSAAIRINENYLLSGTPFGIINGRRYRLSVYARGNGNLSFELRGLTDKHDPLFSGQISGQFKLSPETWQQFSMETVALPGQFACCPCVAVQTSGGPVWIDDVEFIELGRER